MWNLVKAGTLSLAIALSSCATLQTAEATFVSDVQVAVKAACAVVPDPSSIVALINANIPGLASVAAFATAICTQVNAQPAAMAVRRGATRIHAPVTVNGVQVNFI